MSDRDTSSADESADGCVNRDSGSDDNRVFSSKHASVRASNLLLTDSEINDVSSPDDTVLENSTDGTSEKSISIHQLISEHSKPLFGYGYRLTGSVADAEDLTQQTFMIAHQKVPSLGCARFCEAVGCGRFAARNPHRQVTLKLTWTKCWNKSPKCRPLMRF